MYRKKGGRQYSVQKNMSKKVVVRRRGRPKTNPTSIHLTLLPDQLERVDKWSAQEGVSRPEACRRLIERGLEAEAGDGQSRQKRQR
jgi:hypothetical protein